EDVADPPAQDVGRHHIDRLAGDGDAARVSVDQTVDRLQRRGFAGAGSADDRDELAPLHRKRHAANGERRAAVERLRHAVERDDHRIRAHTASRQPVGARVSVPRERPAGERPRRGSARSVDDPRGTECAPRTSALDFRGRSIPRIVTARITMAPLPSFVRPPCDDGVIRTADRETRGAPPSARPWVLAATILGSSIAFIDGSVVGVALPAMQADLGTTVRGAQWIVNGYLLMLGALILVGGAAGDRLGRRRIFVAGLTLLAAASVGCGLAPNIGTLVAMRALQGVGGALLVPSSLAIISAAFPEEERGRAIG